MAQANETEAPPLPPLDVVLCVDSEVYARLRRVLRHLCVGMIDFNAAVRLVAPSPEIGGLTLGPIQMLVYDEAPWPARLVGSARRRWRVPLLEKLAERPPTLVHVISRGSYEAAAAIADRFEVDLIVQFTALDDVYALPPSLAVGASHFISCSQPIRDLLERHVEGSRNRQTLISPGLLAGAGPTCLADPDRTPTLLCTTGLLPGSGLQRLLRAARILKDHKRRFLMFLTGAGPHEASLRKQAHELGLDTSVIFARPTGNVEGVMIGADIFVQPAPQTALSSDPYHAMANGMAVIAVAGGAADVFIDGVTALVCPEGDAERLAQAIERLLSDREAAIRLGRGAVGYMKTHHAISRMVEQTVQVYRDLVLRRATLSFSPQGVTTR